MTVSPTAWVLRARPLVLATALIGAIASCDEQLESGLACPALCPQQSDSLRDTILFAVEFDTSIGGFPQTGTESQLLLATRGDTIDARAIVRFDSLQSKFRHKSSAVDSDLVAIDAAVIKLRVARSDTLGPGLTVEVYDVDTTGADAANDTTVAVLLPTFTGARLIGARSFAAESLKDSIQIPIDKQVVLDKILAPGGGRLRVGLRVTAAQSAELSIVSSNGGFAPLLFIRPSADTTVENIVVAPFSKTPDEPTIAAEVADFQLIARSPPPPPADVIRVGGAPASRAYLRLNIPSRILDSSTVVRATLLMTQRPNPAAPNATETAGVVPFELAAGRALTDLSRALVFLGFPMDSAGMAPKDSAVRSFEMISALRRWRFTSAARTPRAIALRATREGQRAWQVDFYSQKAPVAVRPRLRLTYIPQLKQGLP